MQHDDDHNDHDHDDEGLFVLDNTNNTLDARPVKSLQGVVWVPTPWKSATDVLTETETRELTTKPTVFVLHHKRESVTSLFHVSSPLIASGTSAVG